jgi:NADPH:quinone reductase-like Zn-dependent oxidoreductase
MPAAEPRAPAATTRRRVVIARPGGYDALRLIEEPLPQPGPGEVRIAVAAAGVNYADGIIRMGLYESAKRLHGYPITPGFEAAGRIDAVGPGVDGFAVGDRVVAVTLFGGYASHLVLPADRVFALPATLSFAQGAAIPTVFLTAWFMAERQVHPEPGDRWLVHSAAGGVGGALAQLGRHAGVTVVGVVGGAHKVEAARAAGCAEVVVADAGLWPRIDALAPRGFEAVFDANGVRTLRGSYRRVRPTGKLVIYGFASMLPRDGRLNWARLAWDWLRTPRFMPLLMTRDNVSVMACNLSFLSSEAPLLARGMRTLLARFARGELVPPPVSTFPLDRAADAQRAIESGRTVGKLVLVP